VQMSGVFAPATQVGRRSGDVPHLKPHDKDFKGFLRVLDGTHQLLGTQRITNSRHWSYKRHETGHLVMGGGIKRKWLCSVVYFQAVYLCKRTMQNKARLELADYEAESLARLQRAFARKWEFIFMQAEAQAKVDKKRDKIERKILDSQERAFWDVHRPVPGCVNTTEVDIKKSSRMRNPHKTRKSVYGLQNDIRSHSPTHTPTPETKPPTEEELQQQIKYWQIQLDRHRLKMSKVADSLLGYTEQYLEYDPFLVPPDPSNPWLSDDTTFWELEASKEPSQQRVKRWGFGMDEALKDPVGREQFLKFLESEFSSENLRFWLAVEDLKKRPIREVPSRVQEIWQEFLAPGAPSAINLDSKSYDKTTQNVKEPGRYTFEDAQEHIYKLMKSDSYPRFIRSSAYQELLQAKKKVLVLCDLFRSGSQL
uniref:Regulator of G protein signaling 7 n=1 Tax=Ursus americanus TaxID=9643 RepID=A0A452RJ36_URSAM